MNDTSLPTYLTRSQSLTNADLCTRLGAEPMSLCQAVTADGRLAPAELDALRQWLSDAEGGNMPASRHLRGVIEKVLADGRITPDRWSRAATGPASRGDRLAQHLNARRTILPCLAALH